jgi:hypothetical protein
MKKTVTLALMMLIGGYGAAHTQELATGGKQADGARPPDDKQPADGAVPPSTVTEMEDATKKEEATKDFLGLKWGAGIGVIGGFGGDRAVEKASIVKGAVRVEEEGDLRPQVFLEMHVFLGGPKVRKWRAYQRWEEAEPMKKARGIKESETPQPNKMPDCPLMGFGPFVALQSGDNKAIDSLSLGFMWGFRRDASKSASVNIGIGLSFDPSVQVLGGGIKDGQPMPNGETEIRFKKQGQFGWAVMTSFTF